MFYSKHKYIRVKLVKLVNLIIDFQVEHCQDGFYLKSCLNV